MKFCLLANPENRRSHYFVEAIKAQGFVAPIVVSYLDILHKKVDFNSILEQIDCLRIESFGENIEVHRHFLSLGANHKNLGEAQQISSQQVQQLVFEHGRIAYLRQAHVGFLDFLNSLELQLNQHPSVQLMNSIEGIKLVFDKIACHQHFEQLQIPVPTASYSIKNYEDLRVQMQANGWNRVFIKPVFGSSASGVIAYRNHKNQEQAITSTEIVHTKNEIRLYNSLKVQEYKDNKTIRYLVDTLAKEGILVEQWIPKASFDTGVFDLRMVVIDGKATHCVVRQSQSPMTNLHLGNQRGELSLIQEYLGLNQWQTLCTLAEKAAQTLPNMHYIGLDIMLSSTLKKSYVLEANAFGDLLPNVLVSNKNTYAASVSSFYEKHYAKN